MSGGPPLSCSKVNPQSGDSVPSVSGEVPVESKSLDDKDYVVRCSVDQLDEIQGRLLANDGKDVTQENGKDHSKRLPFKDIIEESTLQCPPPTSERKSLSESTGPPERPPSRKECVDQEDLCEDVDKLPSQCTEENPQKDQLLDNEDSQITYLQFYIGTLHTTLRETSGSLVTEDDVAEESQNRDDLKCPTQCSEPNPENDEQVKNEDEDVPRAGKGPFVHADGDGDVNMSSPSTELKPKHDKQV